MFEWLQDYRDLKQQLDYKLYKLEDAKSELHRWVSGDLSNVRLTKDSLASNLEQHIIDLHSEVIVLQTRLDNLSKMISKFDDLDSQILKMKYLDGLSLYEIAEEMAYSYDHIRRKHSILIKSIKLFDACLLDELESIK